MNKTNLEIGPGCQVTLHFALSTPEGNEAVSTFDEQPVQVTIGQGDLAEGLELALFGLKSGEKQTLLLEAEQAFGSRDEGKIQTMSRSDFPQDMPLEPGLVIGFEAPSGAEVGGVIAELEEESVIVDFNHPLAGNDVVFTVEILEIKAPTMMA